MDIAVRLTRPSRTDPYGVANKAAAATLTPLVLAEALTQMAAAPTYCGLHKVEPGASYQQDYSWL